MLRVSEANEWLSDFSHHFLDITQCFFGTLNRPSLLHNGVNKTPRASTNGRFEIKDKNLWAPGSEIGNIESI